VYACHEHGLLTAIFIALYLNGRDSDLLKAFGHVSFMAFAMHYILGNGDNYIGVGIVQSLQIWVIR